MSEEKNTNLINEEDSGYATDPQKAEKEEFRNFVEEPGDDDGENRNPTEHNTMLIKNINKILLFNLSI